MDVACQAPLCGEVLLRTIAQLIHVGTLQHDVAQFRPQVKDHVTPLSELAKEYTDMLPLYQTVVDMQNGAAFKTLECRKGIQAGTVDVCQSALIAANQCER